MQPEAYNGSEPSGEGAPTLDGGEPSEVPSPFELIRDELYRRLIEEDPDRPQTAITLATLYARFETEVPATMQRLDALLTTLDGFFGQAKGSKLLGLLGVKGSS